MAMRSRFALCTALAAAVAAAPPAILGTVTVAPSAAQLAWHAYEVGAMFTFNLQTFCVPKGATNATTQLCQAGAPSGPLVLPTLASIETLALPRLDTDAWLAVAASFGARYAVLVADHMSGFTLWPTRQHNVSIASTLWRGGAGDVVADFLRSCKAARVAPGVFYSTHYNWVLGVNEYAVGWPRTYGGPPLTQAAYEDIVLAQLQELAAYQGGSSLDYWRELWFDGGVNTVRTPRVGAAVRRLFPNATCHSCANFTQGGDTGFGLRWCGSEEGVMPLPAWGACTTSLLPYGGAPTGDIYAPASSDTVLSEHYWFWQRAEAAHVRSTCALVGAYLTSVGRAGNLILNVAPDDTGGAPAADAAAYAALGTAIACLWRVPLGEVASVTLGADDGAAVLALPATPLACSAAGGSGTACGWRLSLHLQESLAATGQRIAMWTAEACVVNGSSSARVNGGNGGAVSCAGTWVPLLQGFPAAATAAIGSKRIVEAAISGYAAGATITALRITALEAYAWGGPGSGTAATGAGLRASDTSQEGQAHDSRFAASLAPLVLARVALYDWVDAAACMAQNCTLPRY